MREATSEPQVLREYNEALVRQLDERNRELDLARIEIEHANEALEARVRERTAALLLANEQLDAFNHVLVHHLRSPLAAISGFSELLLDKCAVQLGDNALSHLRFISEAAARMNGRATNLLRLARANRATIIREPVNLSLLADAAMSDLMAREPKRACEWSVTADLVTGTDVSLMRVALVNLLENAWRHTRRAAAPRIEFGLVQDTDEPIFFVRDNGDGFDQETADRLFNLESRFQQASVLPAAGIGLRTVRRIITRLGGRVWAEGAPGRGATFYFTPGAIRTGRWPMKALRILVADDHEIVREGVRALVERQPDWILCGEAATGREAVQKASELKPDVIVMDLSMPELNGLDATRQIKRLLPKTEILIFTADEADDRVRSLFKAGARAYLLKSDTIKHLAPAINALRAHRTYFSSRVSELVFSGYLKDEAPPADGALTPRERETVQLVAEGKTNKEIAALLGISVKTVESHRAGIMKKLRLGSIAELVRYAIRNGLAQP